MDVRDFRIEIAEEVLEDLRTRLRNTRWPTSLDESSWADGASLSFLRRLREHWLHHFDWHAQEARLNRLPHYMARIDGHDVHFIHRKGVGKAALPLILTHGWPGSFVEMERLIPLLADPAANGGDASDAFDVVVPSLPGYGFSGAPERPGHGSREIAMLWRKLMGNLGYGSFAAQGGDIGAAVSTWLARLYPDSVVGIHLNYIPGSFHPPIEVGQPVTLEEQAFLDRRAAWAAKEGAYGQVHATKPQTLAFSLADSPIGLAAWIAEKFHAWSDCDGDVERAVSLDHLLTNISIYWFSGSLTASLRLYKENSARPLIFTEGERISPPMGLALFPRELPLPPRSWVDRVFDVRQWNPMPRGGHFAAMEQPELLAEDIRAFFRPLRAVGRSR